MVPTTTSDIGLVYFGAKLRYSRKLTASKKSFFDEVIMEIH